MGFFLYLYMNLKEEVIEYLRSLSRTVTKDQAQKIADYYHMVFKRKVTVPNKPCSPCVRGWMNSLNGWAEQKDSVLQKTKKLGKFVGVPLYESSKETQQQRKSICLNCDQYTGLTCKKCGCIIYSKAKDVEEQCPLNKW